MDGMRDRERTDDKREEARNTKGDVIFIGYDSYWPLDPIDRWR
jgi:hypothetical protein